MVIAYHLMWTLYGWWLPNDPRGSTSRAVASDPLRELGELHYGRRRVQPPSREIREFYVRAGDRLRHPLLAFAPAEFPAVATALGEAIRERGYTCYAAAVLPDHVHLVLRKHRDSSEQMVELLQAESRSRLQATGLRGPDHPTWTLSGWRVYLDAPADVWRTIGYIERNPTKMRLPTQTWPEHRRHQST